MKMPTNLALNYEMPALSDTGGDQINCLLLDDDRFDRITFKRLISGSNLNMKVLDAKSISEAREFLSTQSIDILFLDNNLPDGLGMVLSRELRNVKKFADLPIVMLSGSPDEQLISAALDSGCTAILDKSDICSDTLERTVKAAIRDSQPNATSAGLSPAELDAAKRQFTSDSVVDLNGPVLRLIRLSKKLQAQLQSGQNNGTESLAAEIEALSFLLQRRLNDLIIYDQPNTRIKQ